MAEVVKKKEKPVVAIPEQVTPTGTSDFLGNAESWFVKNQKGILYAGGALALLAGAIVFWITYQKNQNEAAQREMFQAIYYFENDSLNKAIKGDGNHLGFADVADEYGMTKSGKLAHFYLGVIYLKQGKYQEAIDNLEDFSSDDLLIQPRAYALTGDAYSELNNLDEAAKYYEKAANYKPNKYFTPTYLMKLAIVQEAKKDYAGAIKTYDRIINDYFESAETPEARKYKARAEGLAGGV